MLYRVLQRLAVVGLISVAALSGTVAATASWPQKPVTLVVPFPPGGSTDVLARLFAATLGERLGQSVVVENRPGANTGIGAAAVARAAPDGYTLMITGAPTFTTNWLLYPNIGYDPVKSYEYVAIAGSAPFVILTNPQTGLTSVADVIKAKDAQSFGSFGTASTPHLAGEFLAQRTGAKLLHVPYRGSAPAMTDLIGNQIPLSIETLVAALPQIRAGKVRALALTGAQRSSLVPEVPAVIESGVPDYDFMTWFGLVAPRGTPAPVVQHLAQEVQAMLAEEGTLAKMRELGFEPFYADAAAFHTRVERELKRNAEVIKSAGIKVE
ncbi:Bug family tripartite tricarboxylate transporter substrate binding protein [Bordetella holmesii]|uniref:Tripartite tricarboxylate transporter family receptor n=2 Tax=Bordetella holmesii TaxID=35814 RepID=A0A158M2S9_9BORD|nr:tripartite tricarboxylate transporter substrate binding protein [Bordetella holmesii]AHV93975.1 tripartite tricarboxylate transporter receptor family protein [Bordetella holmesii ATCC 51541]AIT26313.1 tripartite tricarboxylate transporter receptor family protein [Bordetella holmesii 44057]EWM42968.1 tripartite tricarboxylate transporter receptor family protein [Bordetella holmesii 41130]EWM46886.1 tripartite tricarboxylate transporter receptor family protein [Bordetella holmesii 35009]EWM51